MEYSYLFRPYPNPKWIKLIHKTFGYCRFALNCCLAGQIQAYQETGKSLFRFQQDKQLARWEQQLPRLRDVDFTALQSSVKGLDSAYQNFFRGK